MNKLNPRDFPLIAAKDIQTLIKELSKIVENNADYIVSIDSDRLFELRDKMHDGFFFIIDTPDSSANSLGTTFFNTIVKPGSAKDMTSEARERTVKYIIEKVNEWIQIIKEYHSISFDIDDQFLKQYEDEIYIEFENIDEDAKQSPFDLNQQLVLYKFLEATVYYLSENHPDNRTVEQIISETNSLKDDISNVSKSVATRRLSKILAKIRKFNPLTYKDIYDVAKKEVIKYLLQKGVEALPKLVDGINALI
jgi:vacuolar-type H+-ATPase subunit E/Vma4